MTSRRSKVYNVFKKILKLEEGVAVTKLDYNAILNKSRQILESFYLNPVILAFGFITWVFNLVALGVFVFSLVFSLILIFCKDVKNIFCPLFFVATFIPDVFTMTDYTWYYVAVIMAMVTMFTVLTVRAIKERKTVKKGRIFYGFLACTLAFLLGGVVGRFNFLNTLKIIGFSLATYVFYFIAVNFTENLKDFFEKVLPIGAFFIGCQIIYGSFLDGNDKVFFNALGVNTCALFVVIGLSCCLGRALKNNKDYLYALFAIFLNATIIISKSRMAMLLAFAIDFVYAVILIKNSKNRKVIVAMTLSVFAISLILTFSIPEFREVVENAFFGKKGLSGRGKLWEWCLERFYEHPVFGYGFYFDGEIPSLRRSVRIILAHNTFLQWLTSTGIVGVVLMAIFYYHKYKIVFSGKIFNALSIITSIVAVEISGFFDQAATMDPFLPILVIILISAIEKQSDSKLLN